MSDIICAKCGEPWENYADDPQERASLNRTMMGEGCPSCAWGKRCPVCSGFGGEPNASVIYAGCQTCYGIGATLARTLMRGEERWSIGYQPKVRWLPSVKVLRQESSFQCFEGWARQAWIECPDCLNAGPRCSECGGTGKLTRKATLEDLERSAHSVMDATDEEPVQYIDAIFKNNGGAS